MCCRCNDPSFEGYLPLGSPRLVCSQGHATCQPCADADHTDSCMRCDGALRPMAAQCVSAMDALMAHAFFIKNGRPRRFPTVA